MAISHEERVLIAHAIKRDHEAFATLYVQYYDAVMRRVTGIVDNREEAADITSEAFLRAWNAISRFEDRDISIQAWLCTIAERLAFKHLKKRRPQVELDNVSLEANSEESPERILELQTEAADVRLALVELPDMQRQVLSKRFLEGLSYDDIGASLGKPVGTVRVIQHRALRALRVIVDARRRLPVHTGGNP
jgi:RNA polymerase sigma-70 factor (ECF subfamily)